MRSFVPQDSIPYLTHGEVYGAYAPGFIQRAQLWSIAVGAVDDPRRSWCEFGVGEGESLDWFASRKPRENLLIGFDSFEGIPEPWLVYPAGQWKTTPYQPNRDDVRIVAGRFEQTLGDPKLLEMLTPQLGLVHIDCDLYSATKVVFGRLGERFGPGTVVLFDEFFNYPEWMEHEAKAFREFVEERGVRFEYLVRTDGQLVLRILAVGVEPEWSIRPIDASCIDPVLILGFKSPMVF